MINSAKKSIEFNRQQMIAIKPRIPVENIKRWGTSRDGNSKRTIVPNTKNNPLAAIMNNQSHSFKVNFFVIDTFFLFFFVFI